MSSTKLVLFIQWEDKLSPRYFEFATLFNEFNYKLIPIHFNQLSSYKFSEKQNILSFSQDKSLYEKRENLFNRYLKLLIMNRKIRLYDANSFLERYRSFNLRPSENYIYLPLPMENRKIVETIVSDNEKKVTNDKKWVWGKKSKIPLDI